jgi:acetoin:2,6-dichlorophenolindophenol oxidoreductase subunit beta
MSSNAKATSMTMAAAINQALHSAMARDEGVFMIGEDIADPAGGVMKVTAGLSTKFGHDRVLETPISEAAIMGAAVGAAMTGMRPVAEIMINDFLMIAMDQLVNVAAKHHYTSNGASKVPLTVRTGVASQFGSGATHSQSLEAWFMHTPGLKVAVPSTAYDAKGMITSCIFDDDPCVFMEHYSLYQDKSDVPTADYEIPIGKADVKRAGKDVSLISYGWTVKSCLAAAEALAAQGIDAEVIDLRWLLPLDVETVLACVARTRRAVIVHAATRFCGAGAEIASTIHEELFGTLAAPVRRVAAPFVPAPATSALEPYYFPTVEQIVAAATGVVRA